MSLINTELDALLSRVREMKSNAAYPDRNAVAYDCYRMFEDLATRYKEEFAMRDRYQSQARQRLMKILEQHDLLREVAAIDDGDEPLAWKYEGLFKRIHDYIEPPANPHASDCNSWLGEPCNCVVGKPDDWRSDWEGQPEL